MKTKQEQRFIDALMSLQMKFKDEHGRFPTSRENNKLVDTAEKIAEAIKHE